VRCEATAAAITAATSRKLPERGRDSQVMISTLAEIH
jgi:hypothetical protein